MTMMPLAIRPSAVAMPIARSRRANRTRASKTLGTRHLVPPAGSQYTRSAWLRAAECPYNLHAAQRIFAPHPGLARVHPDYPDTAVGERTVPARPPALASWSDAQLAHHLSRLIEEVQRRIEKGTGTGSELEAAVKQARESLQRLVPRAVIRAKTGPQDPARLPLLLQEGQRKAVRAPPLAGVAPTQVAKHFGLSLAVVRKVLAEAA